jgi:hypothetical protein
MASVTMAISIFTSRRAFSTGAVIAAFVILTSLGEILVETLGGSARQYGLLVSPLGTLEGMVYWVFGVDPLEDSSLARADLGGGYLLATFVYIAVCLAVLYRRILKMTV